MNRKLPFHIVDVFAQTAFAGNQLAVVLDVKGLPASKMQDIAAEFHFSETTFVTSGNPYRVRIFTPKDELPFAGHPTLGTAFVIQRFLLKKKVSQVTLDLKVGKIPVDFDYRPKPPLLWMRQKEPEFGSSGFDPEELAKVLGIDGSDIDLKFPIEEVSTGNPFIIVPLLSLSALKKCSVDRRAYFEFVSRITTKSILVFSREPYRKGSDISVRVFAEYYGVPEDPATGSGNGCLAAYLSKHRYFGSSMIDVSVDQGYEVGRAAKLYLKAGGADRFNVSVGGTVVPIAKGEISIET